MQSHFIYHLQLDSLFLPGGDFPPSVAILHMYPCIEYRYVPLLRTSLFSHYDTRFLLVYKYKAVLFFFKLFKYLKKSKQNQKTKKPDKERCYLLEAIESCCLRTEHYISHPLVGVYFDLGVVLIYLSLSPPTR